MVLRGPSGAGKSTLAAQIRSHCGPPIAVIGQDTVRRLILKEKDVPGGVNISMISLMAAHALDSGHHVVLEGIMAARRYAGMLTGLAERHRGTTRMFYLDVSFSETLRRHTTRPQAAEFGEPEMRSWYLERDLLPDGREQIIPEEATLQTGLETIMRETGLSTDPNR
ncbi:kinase [Nocardiopsis sp. CNT-189]